MIKDNFLLLHKRETSIFNSLYFYHDLFIEMELTTKNCPISTLLNEKTTHNIM